VIPRVSTIDGIKNDFNERQFANALISMAKSPEPPSKTTAERFGQQQKHFSQTQTREEGMQIERSDQLGSQPSPPAEVREETSKAEPEKEIRPRGRAGFPEKTP
jgi:hypothetical protein